MGKRIVFSTNGAEIFGYPHTKKFNLEAYLTQYTKICSKWNVDLNVRVKSVKLLHDLGLLQRQSPF